MVGSGLRRSIWFAYIYIYKLYDIVDFYNIFINGFTNFILIVRIVEKKNVIQIYINRVFAFFPFTIL